MRNALKATLAAMLVALTGLAGGANDAAAQTRLTLAHVAPPQSSYQDAATRFAESLARRTDGGIAVDIVPGGAMGGLGELWVQARTGSLDLHLIDIGGLVAMQEGRGFLVVWAPFLFDDGDHLARFLDSDLFAQMMGEVEAATGLVHLGIVGDRSPRVVTTARTPVTTPADLAGLRIRTPEHPFIIQAFGAWGATATPLPASEMMLALRSGLVDGQDNGLLDFVGPGFAEVQKHFAPIDYLHSAMGLWISGQTWARLSQEEQEHLREAAREAGEAGRALHAEATAAAMARLDALGVAVSEPDREAFRAAVADMVRDLDGKAWPAGRYDAIRGM